MHTYQTITYQESQISKIVSYVLSNSYLELDSFDISDENIGEAQFITRRNGSIQDETPSRLDINEGKRVGLDVINKFDNVKAELELVDEWVYLTIKCTH